MAIKDKNLHPQDKQDLDLITTQHASILPKDRWLALTGKIQLKFTNASHDTGYLAYMFKYDTTHGATAGTKHAQQQALQQV